MSLYMQYTRRFQRWLILETLNNCGGNKIKAAQVLGFHRNSLDRYITLPNIKAGDYNQAKRPVVTEEAFRQAVSA